MLDYLLLVVMALAGFAGAPWWFVLVGATGLSLGILITQYQFLRRNPKAAQEWEAWFDPAGQVAINIGFTGASYLVGWLIGAFL
jgi:hypothetical protein